MDFLEKELNRLQGSHLLRKCQVIDGGPSPRVCINGRDVLLLCSNDYLGMASHPRVKQAAQRAIVDFGCGSGASRLVSGTLALHLELERRIAQFKNTEGAILFNSGYMANLGTIPALMGEGDAIFSDELNHASIIDGCRLSKAKINVYPHRNMEALEGLLKTAGPCRRKMIVTEGIFSMQGDIAPLPEIVALAQGFGGMTMVDDAHAIGILGAQGRGTTEHFGLEGRVEIEMGTLGKALGTAGAFVTGKQALVNFLINKARTFIFATALPPSVVASATAALNVLTEESDRRTSLREKADYLRKGLLRKGFTVLGNQTPIIPVLIGDAALTAKMSERLLEEGIYARGIRPPAVPRGASRIRATVMTTHRNEDLDYALEAFRKVGQELGIIG